MENSSPKITLSIGYRQSLMLFNLLIRHGGVSAEDCIMLSLMLRRAEVQPDNPNYN
jgi:hypothetical protein